MKSDKVKFLWSTLAVLMIGMMVLTACATPTPETITVVETVEVEKEVTVVETVEVEVEVMAEKEPVTLKVMNYSQEQADFYALVAEEFQKEYPWITVEWDTIAQQEYNEALPLMFRSKDAPDIFFWVNTANKVLTMQSLYDLGWIRSLSPTAELPEGFLERWPEGSFQEGVNMKNGVVYTFPFNDNVVWGPGYMFMNGDVFDAAGLDMNNPPQTWSELKETCLTIKEKTGTYCLAIPLKGTDFQRTWYPLSGMAMTDRFFDYKNGRFALDDPKLLDAFNFIQDLYREELVVPGVEAKEFSRASMATGQAAIYFGGAWMPGVFKSMGFEDLNLGVALPPHPDNGQTGKLSSLNSENKFFVSSQSQHPEEAWLFIEWMTRPDGFFAKEYLAQGFGTLAFTDNAKYSTDPAMAKVAEIGPQIRVFYPEPLVACPATSESTAYSDAENSHKNWEWEVMVEALTSGKDLAPLAAELAKTKNDIFMQTLENEAASGLQVSLNCYAFPEWNYTENYDTADYEQHQP